MNLDMRFPKPSLAARKKMIARISDRAEFRLDADETAKLARLRAAPALIAARHSWEITQVNELLTWDGAPPPSVRLHDQRDGPAGPRDRAPLPLQGALSADDKRPDRSGPFVARSGWTVPYSFLNLIV